jgi:hypothetical protein
MSKKMFALLFGLSLGFTSLVPVVASAATYQFAPPNQNQGAGS